MTIGADTPNTLFYNQFDFNKDGNLTYFKNFSSDFTTIRLRTSNALHTCISRYKYVFDKNGIKKTAIADIQSDSSFTSKYEFDTNGNLIKFIPNMGDSTQYIADYRYDKAGNMIGLNPFADNSRKEFLIRYRYNNNKDLVEMDGYEAGSAIVKTTFIYPRTDSHQNWTMSISITTRTNLPEVVKDTLVRKITYY